MRAARRACLSTFVALASGLVVFLVHAAVSAHAATAAAWTRPLEEARRAHARGDFASAARLFAEGDRALGGWPYEESPAFDDEGHWVHADERDPIRASFQCPWALSVLALPATVTDEATTRMRADAMQRVRISCSPSEAARAAMLLGDERQAALRLVDGTPPPSGQAPSAEARAWAESVAHGRFPIARDVDEAMSFVRSHVRAGRSIDAECDAPTGRRVHAPEGAPPTLAWMEARYEDEEAAASAEGARPPTAFETGTPDAIAWVRCRYLEPADPYEEPMMGPGAETVGYFLVRTTAGIQIAGWFRDQWEHECWTGVVQGEIGHEVVRLPGGRRLYTITRVEGFEDFDSEDLYQLREIVVCDPVRLGCRVLPIAVEETTHTYPDDPDSDQAPTAHRRSWRATLSFTGGRARLTTRGAMPPALTPLSGRGMTLDAFFTEHLAWEDTRILGTPPSDPPDAAPDASCPWRVADADGSTNLRADTSSRAPVSATITNGTTVIVGERRGRWWRITAPAGQAGWVWAPNLAQRCP